MRGRMNDLTGMEFEKLRVLERDMTRTGGNARWICKCACGNIKSVVGSKMLSGAIKSCGCMNYARIKSGINRPERAKPGYCYNVWCQNRHNFKGAWSCRYCRGCTARVVTRRSKRKVLKLGKEI